MRLSRRAEYALLAMVDLAGHAGPGLVQLHEIATRQQIPEKYLEQLLRPLRSAALIVSVRGARGGYRLARPAREVTLLEVVEAVEGSLLPSATDGAPVSPAVREVSAEVAKAVRDQLARWTVQDLAERDRRSRHGDNWVI